MNFSAFAQRKQNWCAILFIMWKCVNHAFCTREDDNVRAETVTAARYIGVLQKFWTTLCRQRLDRNTQWFMQDGVSSHTAGISRDWLQNKFGERVISLRTNFEWTPHSPDLNPLDFFLWVFFKDAVYRTKPATIHELKDSIRRHIRDVD